MLLYSGGQSNEQINEKLPQQDVFLGTVHWSELIKNEEKKNVYIYE